MLEKGREEELRKGIQGHHHDACVILTEVLNAYHAAEALVQEGVQALSKAAEAAASEIAELKLRLEKSEKQLTAASEELESVKLQRDSANADVTARNDALNSLSSQLGDVTARLTVLASENIELKSRCVTSVEDQTGAAARAQDVVDRDMESARTAVAEQQ